MKRRSLQNISPCRRTRATLLTTLFTIFIISLYPQPSSASPIPIPIPAPATGQQNPFNPFEPGHDRVVNALEPSNYPGSNPSEPNNTPGSTGTGSSTASVSNTSSSSDDGTSQPRGLNWSHLSSVFFNEICKNDGRAILLGFLIGCLGTWLIHVLAQRYLLKRGWGVVVWPSRTTRRNWDSRRHGNVNGSGHGNGNGASENVMTRAGERGPDERSSDPPRTEMGPI